MSITNFRRIHHPKIVGDISPGAVVESLWSHLRLLSGQDQSVVLNTLRQLHQDNDFGNQDIVTQIVIPVTVNEDEAEHRGKSLSQHVDVHPPRLDVDIRTGHSRETISVQNDNTTEGKIFVRFFSKKLKFQILHLFIL